MYNPEKLLEELDRVITDNEGNPLIPRRILDKISDIQDWLDARSTKTQPESKENYDGKGLT
jgi:hypothetical protein